MRRVVVTPTFAAGLGVVVAAVLAYPMQTVFSYAAPGALGQGGLRCGQDGCSRQPSATGQPEPFGAAGGALNPSPSASAKPAGEQDGSPGPSGQRTGTGGAAVVRPRLSYKITSKWQGGFWGQIIITFPGDVPANWHLRFGYPGGHILGMNPDSHLAPNGHAAVVRSSDYAMTGAGPDRRTFVIGVGVQGVPTHPARCSFDGKACHIG
jgi:Cellulose binding domain